jgi:hypothetical protein
MNGRASSTNMKKIPFDPRPSTQSVRRSLLGALAGVLTGCGSVLQGGGTLSASDSSLPYSLTPPERARRLRELVPRDAAEQAIEAARLTLGRSPRPIPLVRTAGLLPGHPLRIAGLRAQDDWREVRMQALAFRLSGDEVHARHAIAYLDGWTASYSPSFNPIDETQLPSILWGFDLLQDILSAHLVARVHAFAAGLARGYLAEKPIVGDPSTETNNWQSHRIKIGTSAAFACGDAEFVARARHAFALHVMRNIRPDGNTLDFEERDGLHYTVYTLEPMIMAAACAAAHGHDWYGMPETEGRLTLALDWLKPYALGERQHEEFVHTKAAFDRARAKAGVSDFIGLFKREKARYLYWIAAQLDPRFKPVNDALSPPSAWAEAHQEWKETRSEETVGYPHSWVRALFSQTFRRPAPPESHWW